MMRKQQKVFLGLFVFTIVAQLMPASGHSQVYPERTI